MEAAKNFDASVPTQWDRLCGNICDVVFRDARAQMG
jgi:hypothetical protein